MMGRFSFDITMLFHTKCDDGLISMRQGMSFLFSFCFSCDYFADVIDLSFRFCETISMLLELYQVFLFFEACSKIVYMFVN